MRTVYERLAEIMSEQVTIDRLRELGPELFQRTIEQLLCDDTLRSRFFVTLFGTYNRDGMEEYQVSKVADSEEEYVWCMCDSGKSG